jgi:hypothetical protein
MFKNIFKNCSYEKAHYRSCWFCWKPLVQSQNCFWKPLVHIFRGFSK